MKEASRHKYISLYIEHFNSTVKQGCRKSAKFCLCAALLMSDRGLSHAAGTVLHNDSKDCFLFRKQAFKRKSLFVV